MAREVTLRGTGTPRREFPDVDDLANADGVPDGELRCVRVVVNIGVGEDLTTAEPAAQFARVIVYTRRIVFDPSCRTEHRACCSTCPAFMPLAGMPRSRLSGDRFHVSSQTYRDALERHWDAV